jgi:prephenate dehydrogenase
VKGHRLDVTVVGLGLVGGSLARALSAAGHRVTGVDRPAVLGRARAARAVSRTATRLEAAAETADLVVLAAPPATNIVLLRRLARVLRPGLVVTDVSSVKGPIVREATRLGLATFVGGHPMAGTERRGFAASSARLFRGAAWWIVPAPAARANRLVGRLVREVGARPVAVEAGTHDRAVAFLSHAPQVVAWALAEAAGADPVTRGHLRQAGPGFRDMTRLARSPRRLWRDILETNRTELTRALAAFQRCLRAEA